MGSFNPSYTGYATGSSSGGGNCRCGIRSFNPSYTGYATGRVSGEPDASQSDEFQSFLYWICYWKDQNFCFGLLTKSVSILLILDMLLEDGCRTGNTSAMV